MNETTSPAKSALLLELASAALTQPSRQVDLRIDQITTKSSIHSDHLDRFPDSAKPYTSSMDAALSLAEQVSDPLSIIGQALTTLAGEMFAQETASLSSKQFTEILARNTTAAILRNMAQTPD